MENKELDVKIKKIFENHGLGRLLKDGNEAYLHQFILSIKELKDLEGKFDISLKKEFHKQNSIKAYNALNMIKDKMQVIIHVLTNSKENLKQLVEHAKILEKVIKVTNDKKEEDKPFKMPFKYDIIHDSSFPIWRVIKREGLTETTMGIFGMEQYAEDLVRNLEKRDLEQLEKSQEPIMRVEEEK